MASHTADLSRLEGQRLHRRHQTNDLVRPLDGEKVVSEERLLTTALCARIRDVAGS